MSVANEAPQGEAPTLPIDGTTVNRKGLSVGIFGKGDKQSPTPVSGGLSAEISEKTFGKYESGGYVCSDVDDFLDYLEARVADLESGAPVIVEQVSEQTDTDPALEGRIRELEAELEAAKKYALDMEAYANALESAPPAAAPSGDTTALAEEVASLKAALAEAHALNARIEADAREVIVGLIAERDAALNH